MKEEKTKIFAKVVPAAEDTTQYPEQIPSQFNWLTSDKQREKAHHLEKVITNNSK